MLPKGNATIVTVADQWQHLDKWLKQNQPTKTSPDENVLIRFLLKSAVLSNTCLQSYVVKYEPVLCS